MTERPTKSPVPKHTKNRPGEPLRPARRFARTDGRFDLPVVVGRTPQEVARRLA